MLISCTLFTFHMKKVFGSSSTFPWLLFPRRMSRRSLPRRPTRARRARRTSTALPCAPSRSSLSRATAATGCVGRLMGTSAQIWHRLLLFHGRTKVNESSLLTLSVLLDALSTRRTASSSSDGVLIDLGTTLAHRVKSLALSQGCEINREHNQGSLNLK